MGQDFDVVHLGASHVDEETGAPVAQAVNPIGEDETDVEQHGDVDLMCALGLTALPAPKTDEGVAEAVILKSCGGSEGICVGARDLRTNKVAGTLSPGETCVHSTGDGFDSRIVFKEQLVAIVIGDPVKVGLQLDNIAKKVQISAFGHMIEMSEEQGIVLASGDECSISMKGDTIWIKAPKILLGDKPVALAMVAPTPGAPATSVLIGP